MTDDATSSAEQLRAAWDDMMASLEDARNAIDTPALMPPPATDRNLAEGYRYLMGFMHYAVERAFHEDPAHPHFRNALSIINRSTIDNADAIYFYAAIDGQQAYRLTGTVADHRHWRGAAPAEGIPKAPNYMIFEVTEGVMTGDSGSLIENMPGVRTRTGRLDSSELIVGDDGHFEILLAPERPEDHTGNFISTYAVNSRPNPMDEGASEERYATVVSGRQLFGDWEFEEAVHLEITPVTDVIAPPATYTPESAAAELRRCGELVRNQMHYWNAFWTILLGTYGVREGSLPGIAFPRNAFNVVNAASGATGGGMSTNLASGGVFELTEDEAFIIEMEVRVPPRYMGFQLANLWGESLEYGSRLGSLNGQQLLQDSDGKYRMVVAHQDPGVPNWLDTSGHAEGFLTARWTYTDTPDEADWPVISGYKLPFADVLSRLPADTPSISPEQRRANLAMRQRHVTKRFRAF